MHMLWDPVGEGVPGQRPRQGGHHQERQGNGTSDFSSVHMYSSVHWKSRFLQGTRKTQSCLTGHPVAAKTQCIIRI